jgi:hypothetical protein
VVSSNTSTGSVGSGWSATRYLNVQADASSTVNPVKAAPGPPIPVFPDDQTVVKAGQPVNLSWATSGTQSAVSVLVPGARDWDHLAWQSAQSVSYTPQTSGTYIWVVYTSGPGDCSGGPMSNGSCVSGAGEQRYLIVH